MTISNGGICYLVLCFLTCGYFCSAAVNAWPGPAFVSSSSSGHSYSSGWSWGRSSGGFGGGGK